MGRFSWENRKERSERRDKKTKFVQKSAIKANQKSRGGATARCVSQLHGKEMAGGSGGVDRVWGRVSAMASSSNGGGWLPEPVSYLKEGGAIGVAERAHQTN